MTGVWDGSSKMIVWGGSSTTTNNIGGVWDLGNSWTATQSTDAPAGRYGHTAVWTGTYMIVWGGKNTGGFLSDGAAYNPSGAGTWTALGTSGSPPTARNYHYAAVIGSKMYIWGGCTGAFSPTNTGAVYDFSGGIGTAHGLQ